ncbi:peptidase S8/S53 domain-containing protein [Chytridium lagenaria]|nr:peptidase S8/S53 domain-containing protein [Chytridium lagenaria]
MRFFAVIALAIAACIPGNFAIPVLQQKAGTKIPNQYIVVFKSDANPSLLATHQEWLSSAATGAVLKRADFSAFPQIPKYTGFSYLHRFNGANKFSGYAANISPEIAETLASLPEVAFVEQNTVVSITNAPWGLKRLSQASLPLPAAYTYNAAAGAGVDAYIVDTGVLISHPEFQGRAKVGASYSSDKNDVDGNGHGTHVAGTIGSLTYGVAKKVNLIAVKVLAASGSGTNADVIAGVNYVAKTAPTTGRKSVANMSLGGSASAALDSAVAAAVRAGVTFVVAGNAGGDACVNSPAREPLAITVAASDSTDKIASFSDRGSCVDIIAPGVGVLSTWNNGATNSISGTSMASPHVAGVAALALSTGLAGSTPAEVLSYLTSIGVSGKITGLTSTTKNLLAQVPK